MPTAPARPCLHRGCPNLQPCATHARGQTYAEVKARRPWHALYDLRRWRRLSARVRASHVVCQACRAAGHTPRPTRHVHHVVPHRGDVRLFFDESNLQALCAECHSVLTRKEQLACR